jgi:hypothetical protein
MDVVCLRFSNGEASFPAPQVQVTEAKEEPMCRNTTLLLGLAAIVAACHAAAPTEEGEFSMTSGPTLGVMPDSEGLVRTSIPDEDPGPPLYARVSSIQNQFFHDDGWLAIPFYRPPECVPAEFNVLGLFDPPGETGPGAFGCPLLRTGFLLIEPDAPLGTFPRHAVLSGDAVPFWFVPWAEFQAEAADGRVTFAALEAMDRLTGVAYRYQETLRPRADEHLVVINATGELADGRTFRFSVTHEGDQTKSIRIQLR